MPFFGMMLAAGVMGLADGPTEVHKVTVARQVLRDYRPSDDMWPTAAPPEAAGRGARQARRVPRARGGEPVSHCDRCRAPRRVDGRQRPARQGRADRAALHLGRVAERDLRDPPRRACTARCASRRRPHRPPRDDGILREWRIIEALDGTDVPHTEAIAVCTDTVGAGPHLLPDGFRRRLVADGARPTAGRRRSTPTSMRARVSRTNSSKASRCCRRSTGRPRACRTSAAPTASTSARSTAGPRSSSASRAASCPASTTRRRGCARTQPDRLHPRHSCTATTSSPT